MKRPIFIGLFLLLAFCACHGPRREARRMARRAERLFDSMPDSAARLLDSVLRMPVLFSERERMDMALMQGEALFGDRGQEVPPVMDDELDDRVFQTASPDLEHAADFYARKKRYAEAARAALYSGLVQQHYGENKIAMQSFKDAEQYGDMVGDSLAVAMAQYWMGKMLYNDGMEQDALAQFRKSSEGFGHRYTERAKALNSMACCHLLNGQIDSAEICFKQGLAYADKNSSHDERRKILNNYSVLFQLQGKYDQAVKCLREIVQDPGLEETKRLLLYLNLGDVYLDFGVMDSAVVYYKYVETLLPDAHTKTETKVSAYSFLSRFAEIQHDDSMALFYWKQYNKWLDEAWNIRKEKNVYGILKKYDYDALQNAMNRKVILRQRVIIILSIIAVVVLLAFALSQIRLSRIRKQEAEIKANLLKFSYQNEELMQRHDEYKRTHAEMIQKLSEKEKMYQELLREYEKKCMDAKNQEAEAKANLSSFIHQNKALHEDNEKIIRDLLQKNSIMEKTSEECINGLTTALRKEGHTMLRLDLFMNNQGEKSYLQDLNKIVFGDYDHWVAIMKVFDTLYPGVMQNLMDKHPELTQLEQKDVVCSFLDVSRQDESVLLGISIHKVDRLRNSVRKKLHEKGN